MGCYFGHRKPLRVIKTFDTNKTCSMCVIHVHLAACTSSMANVITFKVVVNCPPFVSMIVQDVPTSNNGQFASSFFVKYRTTGNTVLL